MKIIIFYRKGLQISLLCSYSFYVDAVVSP